VEAPSDRLASAAKSARATASRLWSP